MSTFTFQEQQDLVKLLGTATAQNKVMTLDELHGYLFGLAIIPEKIVPSQWISAIFGGEESYEIDDKKEEELLLGRLFSAYDRITADTMSEEFVFPFDIKNDSTSTIKRARDWSRGLYQILSTSRKIFYVYDTIKKAGDTQKIDGDTFAVCYCILKAVAFPEKTSELLERMQQGVKSDASSKLSDANLIAMLPDAVAGIREYAKAVQQAITNSATIRTTVSPSSPLHVAKIGRNDPCPCGSDKKYKKCCGK